MVVSRVPAAIDAVVALLVAANVKTWDGPVVTGDYAAAVFVGYDGDPDGDHVSAEADQSWAGIGAKVRDEEIDITCAAIALLGDGTVKAARDTVYAMVEKVETALRGTPSLGLSSPCVAEFRPGIYYTEPTPGGYQARLGFFVSVKTRV